MPAPEAEALNNMIRKTVVGSGSKKGDATERTTSYMPSLSPDHIATRRRWSRPLLAAKPPACLTVRPATRNWSARQ